MGCYFTDISRKQSLFNKWGKNKKRGLISVKETSESQRHVLWRSCFMWWSCTHTLLVVVRLLTSAESPSERFKIKYQLWLRAPAQSNQLITFTDCVRFGIRPQSVIECSALIKLGPDDYRPKDSNPPINNPETRSLVNTVAPVLIHTSVEKDVLTTG